MNELLDLVVSHEEALALPKYSWRNSPPAKRPRRTICKHDGCTSPLYLGGLCHPHYNMVANERAKLLAKKRRGEVERLKVQLKDVANLADQYKLKYMAARHKLEKITEIVGKK